MTTSYETDVVAWANEQAALLRSGKLNAIDALNIAEEIESVGRSEQNELKSRIVILLARLLKWQFQPDHRGHSWEVTIKLQRSDIRGLLGDSPSLQHLFDDEKFLKNSWFHAAMMAGSKPNSTCPVRGSGRLTSSSTAISGRTEAEAAEADTEAT